MVFRQFRPGNLGLDEVYIYILNIFVYNIFLVCSILHFPVGSYNTCFFQISEWFEIG